VAAREGLEGVRPVEMPARSALCGEACVDVGRVRVSEVIRPEVGAPGRGLDVPAPISVVMPGIVAAVGDGSCADEDGRITWSGPPVAWVRVAGPNGL
jgi:hypothetical protein